MKVIFDLDGTLSDASHRIPMLEKLDADERMKKAIGNEVWEAFYLASIKDAPIIPMIETLNAFYATGAMIEIWTGRSDFVRDQTEVWLRHNGIDPILLRNMRPHGDHISDKELKRGWLLELRHSAWPDLVFEDRARVVQMWRGEGIRCCQVDVGDF